MRFATAKPSSRQNKLPTFNTAARGDKSNNLEAIVALIRVRDDSELIVSKQDLRSQKSVFNDMEGEWKLSVELFDPH